MTIMKRFDDINSSYVTVRIEAVDIEKILNYLWNNQVEMKNIKNINKFSVNLDVELSDYKTLIHAVKKGKGKLKVINRKGLRFLFIKANLRKFLVVGIAVFFFVLYYLGTFIWKVEIIEDRYLAPIEVRNMLKSYGINVGTKKNTINVEEIEKYLVRDFAEIMWLKVRIEGAKLTVEIIERQEPPQVKEKLEYTGNIVAKKPGVVNRINSSAGTAVVKPGQVVNVGDILIKGQEGKEDKEFFVKAEGRVPATVFHEEIIKVSKIYVKKEATGNKKTVYGINLNNKIIYLGKILNNFANYDKMETKWGIFIKEVYYETKEVEKEVNTSQIVKDLQNKIFLNLDRSVKILDVTPEITDLDDEDKYKIRVVVTVEEDIAQSEVAEPEVVTAEESDNP